MTRSLIVELLAGQLKTQLAALTTVPDCWCEDDISTDVGRSSVLADQALMTPICSYSGSQPP